MYNVYMIDKAGPNSGDGATLYVTSLTKAKRYIKEDAIRYAQKLFSDTEQIAHYIKGWTNAIKADELGKDYRQRGLDKVVLGCSFTIPLDNNLLAKHDWSVTYLVSEINVY